jgi:hypothetical protein
MRLNKQNSNPIPKRCRGTALQDASREALCRFGFLGRTGDESESLCCFSDNFGAPLWCRLGKLV